MHFSAILLSGKRHPNPSLSHASSQKHWSAGLSPSGVLPASFACVELFGQSVLERTVARLKKAGLCSIAVIPGSDRVSFHETKEVRTAIPKDNEDRWTDVKRALLKDVQRGIETVLIAEIGAYVELDLPAALQFHRAKAQPITPIHDALGSLSYWIVDAASVLSSANGFSLPPGEERITSASVPYKVQGYANRLADPRSFRRLVVDAFLGRCSIAPNGREAKPGVWIDDGARFHKTARLVAPSYIGCNVRVQPGAVITRCSNLERNCNVGEGSLVSDASLFPHTMIGRGLDVSSALVDGNDFIHYGRNVSLRIEDAKLISSVPPIKRRVPVYLPEYGGADRPTPDLIDPAYLSRAKGRFLEVFKGEV